MEIITGSKGEPHITPNQDAMWHRAITGASSGVFNDGSKFNPTKINNNTVRIADGVLSIQGRFAVIEPNSYDEVTISNGSQGKNRIDIICAKIFTDSEMHQNAELVVFEGNEAVGEPIEPSIPEKDLDGNDTESYLPLVKVVISDIEIISLTMIGNIFTVVIDPNYVHTDNNFTDEEVARIAEALIKPKINNVELDGNKTLEELEIQKEVLLLEEAAPHIYDSKKTMMNLIRGTNEFAPLIYDSEKTMRNLVGGTNEATNARNFDMSVFIQHLVEGFPKTDNSIIVTRLVDNIPETSTANGHKGEIALDNNYMYICIEDNIWKKISLQTL